MTINYFEFDPNYYKLGDFIDFLGSCFTKVWSVMCRPFIEDFYFTWAGGYYRPVWSYLIPLFAFGFAICAIALVKKLIVTFIGG